MLQNKLVVSKIIGRRKNLALDFPLATTKLLLGNGLNLFICDLPELSISAVEIRKTQRMSDKKSKTSKLLRFFGKEKKNHQNKTGTDGVSAKQSPQPLPAGSANELQQNVPPARNSAEQGASGSAPRPAPVPQPSPAPRPANLAQAMAATGDSKVTQASSEQWIQQQQEEFRRLEALKRSADEGEALARTLAVDQTKTSATTPHDHVAAAPSEAGSILPDDCNIPDEYLCPISQEPMRDPVITAAGITYERRWIENWLRTHDTDPTTNLPLPSKELVPNFALKKLVATYLLKAGVN